MSELTPQPTCTCSHPVDCGCGCHGRYCDPTENACDLEYLPDEGGLARWGCAVCTPGEAAPHLATCPAAVAGPPSRQGLTGLGHIQATS